MTVFPFAGHYIQINAVLYWRIFHMIFYLKGYILRIIMSTLSNNAFVDKLVSDGIVMGLKMPEMNCIILYLFCGLNVTLYSEHI